jgi:hypothetical protein
VIVIPPPVASAPPASGPSATISVPSQITARS